MILDVYLRIRVAKSGKLKIMVKNGQGDIPAANFSSIVEISSLNIGKWAHSTKNSYENRICVVHVSCLKTKECPRMKVKPFYFSAQTLFEGKSIAMG